MAHDDTDLLCEARGANALVDFDIHWIYWWHCSAPASHCIPFL